MRNRAMSYDVAAIEGPRTTSWRFVVMLKNLVAMPEIIVQSSRDIVRLLLTYCDVADVYTIFSHVLIARPSHDIVPWSCDVLRHRTRSHNHRTTAIMFRC